MRMQTTSIIIPNFNGKSLLEACIHSIKEHTQVPYEIIVVDNGSTDGSLELCYREKVKFISYPVNHGFPKACNAGLRIASGDTLLLLNNDTIATPNWLTNMQRCLYSDERIGIVGPMTNYASGRQEIQETFTTIDDFAKRYNEPDPAKWQEVHRIVGICFLFKRELLQHIGYLDESFSPGHYEDDDYCYRARLQGYRLAIAGDVFIYHEGSASFFRDHKPELKELIAVNRQKFIQKWSVDPAVFI
jgi:GT2 family glycosyltransferase